MTRRELLAAALSTPALWAKRHFDRSRISAITDEIGKTPDDSIAFAKQYNLQWIELRNVPGGKEYISLDEPSLKAAAASFKANGLKVSFLNSSLMKFAWPGIEPARRRQETEQAAAMRKAHKVCDDHQDVASASLLENFIDATERRTWFLFEAARGADRSGH